MSTTQGYIDSIKPGEKEKTFTGTIKEGGSTKTFENAYVNDLSGNPIDDINQIGLDSLVSFDGSNNPVNKLDMVVQVIIKGKIERQNTMTQVRNLVMAIEKEKEASDIGVEVKK